MIDFGKKRWRGLLDDLRSFKCWTADKAGSSEFGQNPREVPPERVPQIKPGADVEWGWRTRWCNATQGCFWSRALADTEARRQARSISTGMETWFSHCRRGPLMQAVCRLFLGRCVAVGLSTYCPMNRRTEHEHDSSSIASDCTLVPEGCTLATSLLCRSSFSVKNQDRQTVPGPKKLAD